MTYLITQNSSRPLIRRPAFALLVVGLIGGCMPQSALAQSADGLAEIRIPVPVRVAQENPRSLAVVRRQIGNAAKALCDRGGVSSIYGNQRSRCREQVTADAERQLRARLATLLAAHAPR